MTTHGAPVDFPEVEDIELMLWWELTNWSNDMKPEKYEFMDLVVKNYAFKVLNEYKAAVEFLKSYSSFLDEVKLDP